MLSRRLCCKNWFLTKNGYKNWRKTAIQRSQKSLFLIFAAKPQIMSLIAYGPANAADSFAPGIVAAFVVPSYVAMPFVGVSVAPSYAALFVAATSVVAFVAVAATYVVVLKNLIRIVPLQLPNRPILPRRRLLR